MALSGGTTITIDGSLFQRNGAFWGGGAIFSNTATMTITETKFIENYVDQDLDLTLDSTRTVKCGGALDVRGGSVSIAQSEFRENRVRSPNSEGGAIFALDATLHITATTLVANVAGRAGYYSSDGYYSVQGTGRGGAICIRSSILVMQDSILEKNVQLAQAAGSPPGPGSTALDANGWISQQSFVTLKNVTFGAPLAKAYTWKKRNEPYRKDRPCGCTVPPCKYLHTGNAGSCQLASGWSYPYTGGPCTPSTCQAPAGSPASADNKFVSTQSLVCTRSSRGASGAAGQDEHVVMPNEDTENLVCVTHVFTRGQ